MQTRMIFVVMLFAATVGAAPVGTEFTYQGVLSEAGTPASGVYDFRYLLYDAEVGGSQVGSIVYVDDLAVTDGRMTTQLDFGAVFDGTALWLEVGVRDGVSTGSYAVLSPRQGLTAAPFAQHAQIADAADTAGHAVTADTATTAGDADTLDGQHGGYYLAWSNFVDIPDDIADGDDDTLGDLGCSEGEIARWDGMAWNCSGDDDTPYVRTYVVGPVGTPVENGVAFDLAMASITPPVNQETAVLLKVEPGVYDVGTTPQALFPWMVIEGAGVEVTRITSAACDSGVYTGTFWSTSEHVTLRHLTVANNCGDAGSRSTALSNQGDYLTLDHVALIAEGTALHSTALFNSGADLLVSDSTLNAINGSAANQGLVNEGGGAELFNVFIEVIGGDSARGIDNDGEGLTFKQSRIWAAWGADDTTGIFNHTDANNLNVSDSSISVGGSAPVRCGVHIDGADAALRNLTVNGIVAVALHNWSTSFATVTLYDVYAYAAETGLWVKDYLDGGCLVMIDDGRYNAGVDAVVNSLNSCDVRIGGAYLASGVTGAALCAGVYDWGHTFYPNSCPP